MTSVTELDMRPVEEVLAKYAEIFADEADRQIWLDWAEEFLAYSASPRELTPLLETNVRPGVKLRAYLALHHAFADNGILGIEPGKLARLRRPLSLLRDFCRYDEMLRRFCFELAHATSKVLPDEPNTGFSIPSAEQFEPIYMDLCSYVLQMEDLADLTPIALDSYKERWEYIEIMMREPVGLEYKGLALVMLEQLIGGCEGEQRGILLRNFIGVINIFAIEECLHLPGEASRAWAEEILIRSVEAFMTYSPDQSCRDQLLRHSEYVHVLDWLPTGPREAFGTWLFGGELQYHGDTILSGFAGCERYASEFASSSAAATRNFAAWRKYKLESAEQNAARLARNKEQADRRAEILAAVKMPTDDS